MNGNSKSEPHIAKTISRPLALKNPKAYWKTEDTRRQKGEDIAKPKLIDAK